MKQKRKIKVNKILIKWLLSSLLILLIPIVFGVIIYSYALRTIREDIDYVQNQTLSQVRESVENTISASSQVGLSSVR